MLSMLKGSSSMVKTIEHGNCQRKANTVVLVKHDKKDNYGVILILQPLEFNRAHRLKNISEEN